MPLTTDLPKPMAPYQDSTLIVDGIRKIRAYIPNIHVTVGYKGAMLAQHLIENGVASVLNTDGRSNSWWIYNTLLKELCEPLFVLTCDNITELNFEALEADYFERGAPPCMLVPVRPVPGLAGDYLFTNGSLVTNLSRTEKADSYCSGIQVLNPGEINRLTHFDGDFDSLWRKLISMEKIRVSSIYPTAWFTVDTVDDLKRLANKGKA